MLTLFILIILFIGLYTGVRRGLILQLVYTFGYLLSFLAARQYYAELAGKLEMLVPYPQPGIGEVMPFYNEMQILNLDGAFYNALSFLLILAIGWVATRIIGRMLNSLAFLPVLKQLNTIGGGLLAFLIQYAGVFLTLYFLTLIPIDFIQNMLTESRLAAWIITNTPILSKTIYQWWLGRLL